MKSYVLVALAVLALAVGTAGTSQAAPMTAYDIVFDGYCDGLHLEVPSVGLPGTASSVDGYQTGCITGGAFGTAKANASGQFGVDKGTEYVNTYFGSGGMMFVIKKNKTWVLYQNTGYLIYVVNSGTWSYGTPLASRGVASATRREGAKADAEPESDAGIAGTKNIVFDGYCDGMRLVSPSAGLALTGTVDGNRTGCASDAIYGAKSKIAGARGTYAVNIDQRTLGFQILTVIFRNNTWIHYSISGNNIYVLNSGTWSPGTPLAGGRSSTQ